MFNLKDQYYLVPSTGGAPKAMNISFNSSSNFKWSPDGQKIAIVASQEDKRIGIYVFEPDDHNVKLLVTDIGESYAFKWSSDSSEILFLAYQRGQSATTLGIVNVETGLIEKHDILDGIFESIKDIRQFVWSPDNTQIAFTGVDADENPHNNIANIYLINRDFTQILQLTDNTHLDVVVDWRPQ